MNRTVSSIQPSASGKNELRREPLAPGFFREGPQRLFVCHHLPTKHVADSKAILLCNATGHEYERGHRALRQLAAQLAKAGHHAMRFDYFGTGDSAGEYIQASLAQWRQDIVEAIYECRRQANRALVSVIGLRLGATLAMQAAATRKDVESLVLWDPITDGATLLREWQEAQNAEDRQQGRSPGQEPPDEVLGFPVSPVARVELNTLTIPDPDPSLRRVLLLPEHDHTVQVQRISEILGNRGAHVDSESANAPAIWRQEPMDAIVPFKLLRRIATWLSDVQT